jgi:4-hydroxy 2-oxovalerate aldolase
MMIAGPQAPVSFRLTDSTLRDGSHALSHQFSAAQVASIAEALDCAGVPVIEISHGDGLGGSSFNYGFSAVEERDLIRAAAGAVSTAKLAVLLLPGIGIADDLKVVADLGVQVARVATHCTEADISEQHIGLAKNLGMEAVGFLMMAHMTAPDALAKQARLMESFGADCVYVVDSAGAMTTADARARTQALRETISCQIGFHAHNNLSLGVANALEALRAGATQLDGCLAGLGAGAGNCPTEILAAVCDKMSLPVGVNTYGLMDAAEDLVRPLMPTAQVINRSGLMLGYAGVYGSFLLHAERAAARFGVDVKDILAELGRRGVVGGQEDMIVDVAAELTWGRALPAADAVPVRTVNPAARGVDWPGPSAGSAPCQ